MSDPGEFRSKVVAAAQELFPELQISAPPTEYDFMLVGDKQVGLQNLQAKWALSENPDDDLAELVREHIEAVVSAESPSLDGLSFADARDRLLPQVMPAEYVGSAPAPIVNFPMGRDVKIGIVVDFPQTYAYLRDEDVARWEMDPREVLNAAIENLETASDGMGVQQAGEDKDMFLILDATDGYAAARIVVPSVRAFLASNLGENFRFAVPNRDFLICWRTDCSAEFHGQLAETVRRDSSEQPYPLSPSTFVVNSEGNYREETAE